MRTFRRSMFSSNYVGHGVMPILNLNSYALMGCIYFCLALSLYLNTSGMYFILTVAGCGGLSLAGDCDGWLYESPLCRKHFFSPSLSLYRNIARVFLVATLILFYFNRVFVNIYKHCQTVLSL